MSWKRRRRRSYAPSSGSADGRSVPVPVPGEPVDQAMMVSRAISTIWLNVCSRSCEVVFSPVRM